MSKVKRTHADVADALIASADRGTAPRPSPAAIVALRKVIAYNDTRPRSGASGRVSRDAAVQMLRESFGWDHGAHALEAFVKRALGRKSWGTP